MDNKFKTKRYDLYWIEKQKHELRELKRIVALNNLEDQLLPFDKGLQDFHEDAVNWFEVRDIKVDTSEDIKKPKKDLTKVKEEITKPSKKSKKDISIEEEDESFFAR